MAQFKTNVVKKKYRVYGKIANTKSLNLCKTVEIVEAESEDAVRLRMPKNFQILKIEEAT